MIAFYPQTCRWEGYTVIFDGFILKMVLGYADDPVLGFVLLNTWGLISATITDDLIKAEIAANLPEYVWSKSDCWVRKEGEQ